MISSQKMVLLYKIGFLLLVLLNFSIYLFIREPCCETRVEILYVTVPELIETECIFQEEEERLLSLKRSLTKRSLEWKLVENHARHGANHAPYAWIYLTPVWPCAIRERVPIVGDGGKWVCDLFRLAGRKCVVYSFGSNRDTTFETEIFERTKCEIHIFDPTVSLPADKRWHFHQEGLFTEKRSNVTLTSMIPKEHKVTLGPVDTLHGFAHSLNHSHIDLLKIDIEGSEFVVFDQWLAQTETFPSVSQVLVEIHYPKDGSQMRQLLLKMEQKGLYLFSIEQNPLDDKVAELSFVNQTFVQAFM